MNRDLYANDTSYREGYDCGIKDGRKQVANGVRLDIIALTKCLNDINKMLDEIINEGEDKTDADSN